MSPFLQPFTSQQRLDRVNPRPGETRIGETIGLLSGTLTLENATQQGFHYVLVGIPEDIGPRAM